MKKNFLLACLISAVFAAPAGAWELWDQFKATNLTPEGRVVDYSEAKLITTSEGQSYGMFFALVANDKKAFDEMFAWTEKNLGENQPLGFGVFRTASPMEQARSWIPTTPPTRTCGLPTV